MKSPIRLALILSLLCISILNAETWQYISPGLRIGHNEKHGWELSFQLTLGVLSDGLGRSVPGVTVGATKGMGYHGFYTDLQVTRNVSYDIYKLTGFDGDIFDFPFFGGIGIGKSFYIFDGEKQYYNRFKAYYGLFGFASYEYRFAKKFQNYHNMGAIGVCPLPASNNWQL